MMATDIHGIKLKAKDIVSFNTVDFRGSVLHTTFHEGIIFKIDKSGRVKVKMEDDLKKFKTSTPHLCMTLVERRKREVLVEKYNCN